MVGDDNTHGKRKWIILVILLVKKGYGLVSARSQLYHTRPETECDTAGVSCDVKKMRLWPVNLRSNP